MTIATDYERDGAAIYRASFAIIRSEADLGDASPVFARVLVRMIHACGMTDLPRDVQASPDAAERGRAALRDGAPIFCDATMVAAGVTRARLPRANDVVCTLQDARVPALARELGTTRSAAAIELWRDRLGGSVVAIGNAPTALFHLLDALGNGAPRPALVLGFPVGFVGAAESKAALAANDLGIPYLTLHGRRGGSAIASAAVNALASDDE
ncbi:MAG: precorrin-8X methylmutase [Vulcanimicrobiaceae bacterium]